MQSLKFKVEREREGSGVSLLGGQKAGKVPPRAVIFFYCRQARSPGGAIQGDDDGRRPLEQEIYVTPAKELSPNLIKKLGTQ